MQLCLLRSAHLSTRLAVLNALLAVGSCTVLPLIADSGGDPVAANAPALTSADSALPSEAAPEVFRVKFETSRGDFTVEAHRDWAPHGVDRFFNLVRARFFDDSRFFR